MEKLFISVSEITFLLLLSQEYCHRDIVTGLVANLRGNGYMVRFCDIDVDARSFKGDEKQ